MSSSTMGGRRLSINFVSSLEVITKRVRCIRIAVYKFITATSHPADQCLDSVTLLLSNRCFGFSKRSINLINRGDPCLQKLCRPCSLRVFPSSLSAGNILPFPFLPCTAHTQNPSHKGTETYFCRRIALGGLKYVCCFL